MTPALLEAASVHLAQGRPERAIEQLARLDSAALETPAPWVVRVAALFALDRLDDAHRAAEQALSRWPEHVLLRKLAGAVAFKRRDLGTAERHYLVALRLRPDDPGLLCAYAELVASAGQIEKAERLVERAASFDPEDDAVHRARWVLANLRGDDKEAHRLAAVRVARDPGDASALAALAAEALHAGDVGAARRVFGAAVAADLETARDSELETPVRLATHWALVPLIPVQRFGMVPVTIAGILAVHLMRRVAPPQVAVVVGIGWLLYCLYSWIAPSVVRWHLERRRR